MARWDPDARGRLERAALELFAAQGFEATTVPQIARRAGLTTRTFFRHFADKREVLFAREGELREDLVAIVRDAPAGLAGMTMVTYVAEAVATAVFEPRFDAMRTWRAVMTGDAGLRERQLRKMQQLGEGVVGALRDRGIDQPAADLIAQLATMLVQTSLATWLEQPVEKVELVTYVQESARRLRGMISSDGTGA